MDVEFFVRLYKIVFDFGCCSIGAENSYTYKRATRLMRFPNQHLIYARY
jgi:hypothetical protein